MLQTVSANLNKAKAGLIKRNMSRDKSHCKIVPLRRGVAFKINQFTSMTFHITRTKEKSYDEPNRYFKKAYGECSNE